MTLMLLYEMSVSLGSFAELGELIIYFTCRFEIQATTEIQGMQGKSLARSRYALMSAIMTSSSPLPTLPIPIANLWQL